MRAVRLRRLALALARAAARACIASVARIAPLACIVALAGAAHGQLCADVDLDGAVSLADGVRILRAAAALPEPCPLVVCDVDGSGDVTLADGVLVLRKVANLPIVEHCGTGGVAGTLGIPESAGSVAAAHEREPNDTTGTAEVVGLLAAGSRYERAGAIDGPEDVFDGFTFIAPGGLTLDLMLRFEAEPAALAAGANADLDLIVLDRLHGESLGCESTTVGLEQCIVTISAGREGRALDVVVAPAHGSAPAAYVLTVGARGASLHGRGPGAMTAGPGADQTIDVAVSAYRGIEPDWVENEIVVQFSSAAAAVSASRSPPVDATAVTVTSSDGERTVLLRLAPEASASPELDPDAAVNAAARKRARGAAKRRTRETAEALGARADVVFAHPNYLARTARAPSDALFARQWSYRLIGLPRAWDLETGRPAIIVAVVDSGIRSEHPDLQNRLIEGFDFISDAERGNDGDGLDPDPFDPGDRPSTPLGGLFHGTHVAGTIGAATDNGAGVAGVTWQARLMPLRVLGVGGGTVFDIAQAILFAAGLSNAAEVLPPSPARIINLSLTAPGDVPILRDAVDRATAAGALVVAAAGNGASDAPSSPALFPNSVSVTATDRLGAIAPYSSFGPTVDLAAPGGNTRVDLDGDDAADGILSTLLPGVRDYALFQGTSMAAAHVSGVAALLLSARGDLSPSALRRALTETAQDRGSAGRDDLYGSGIVDPTRALRRVTGTPPPANPALELVTSVLDFDVTRSGLSVHAVNAGGGSLEIRDVTATTDDGAAWLAARFESATSTIEITVSRDGLATGSYRGRVAITSNGGGAEIRILMEVVPPAAVDIGPVSVFLLDLGTRTVRFTTATDASHGYRYRLDGIPAGSYEILAGTDRDGDGSACEVGDYCGAYPVQSEPQPVVIVGGVVLEGRDFGLSLIAEGAAVGR